MSFEGQSKKAASDFSTGDSAEKIFRKVTPALTECALGTATDGICIRDSALKKVAKTHKITSTDRALILEGAMTSTGCSTQKCVLEKTIKGTHDDPTELLDSLREDVKVTGPTNSKLLSNVHIDNTLRQWSAHIPEFFAYNFNMLDYARHSWRHGAVQDSPDTLATVNLAEVFAGKHKAAGCIINSDTYHGPGKHWMALFVDARGRDRWTVEFFNSSGNSPAPEWVNWLVKTRGQLEELSRDSGIPVEIVNVIGLRQQYSKSECGVYSLYYVWARLQGIPPETFKRVHIPDKYMFEFRQHLFVESSDTPVKEFDWAEYQKRTPIVWEKQHHDRG